ncbi:triple tyrosine motif-containing protein [Bacillus cereus]|uniref:triple tyrosine motif-containing protein n=1 Tax=Bacillus cereus TaxID=1396 RepID=UPI000BFD6A5B|nr:triple tyrosine motif-containing protein [Bacillus cereus]PGZ12870.1 hypothetical protein COE46_22765 [Bacillus cereus]
MFKKIIVPVFAAAVVISGCSNEPAKGNTKEKVEQNKKEEKNKKDMALVINEAKINKVNEKTLKVDVKAQGNDINYAYYIYKGEEIVDKTWYKPDTSLTYEVKEPGTYRVKVYAKDKSDKIESVYTSEVKVEK